MAELTIKQGGRRKVQSPRIDFTPMVDLGFLLITFFMFTTTLANPKSMELNMPCPDPTDKPQSFPAESTVTIIPISNHRFVYYKGMLPDVTKLSVANERTVRSMLMEAKSLATQLPASLSPGAHKLHVIIKPAVNSTYGDVVHVLDEMNIVAVPYYVMVDIPADEQRMVSERFY